VFNINVKGGTGAGKRRPKPTFCTRCGQQTNGSCFKCYP
jgi:hypothetical protein